MAVAAGVVAWVNQHYAPCSLGMFADHGDAQSLLGGREKLTTVRDLSAQGKLLIDPRPEDLAALLASPARPCQDRGAPIESLRCMVARWPACCKVRRKRAITGDSQKYAFTD